MASSLSSHALEEQRFRISGMTCAGCAATVQQAIEAQPGVTAASVSVIDGSAVVQGRGVTPTSVEQAVQSKGYDARYVEEAAAPDELRSDIEHHQHHHERLWRYRAIVGLSLWAPLEVMHVFAPHSWHGWMDWAMFAGATVVILVAGWGFYGSALRAALKRTTNMDTLIALGATTAYVYSAAILFLDLDQSMYFAEASGLLGIVSLGHWFEARASAKAGSAVRELLELQPDEAELIASHSREPAADMRRRGEEPVPRENRVIPSAEIRVGDWILVRPGGRIPVDGVVVEGDSAVDEAIVTGEAVPVEKRPGNEVIAGSMNTTGRMVVEASVDGKHTTISRIADLVQRAQTSKAEIQRLADYISSIFVPVVIVIAILTILGWWLIGHDVEKAIVSAVTVLIISCPCALGLATPMAVMVGTGAASQRGILIKSAAALERAGRATQIIFDKTGTLTAGRFTVTNIELSGPSRRTEDEVLSLAASIEAPSEHPIARAIVESARQRGLSVQQSESFRAIAGQGVEGVVNGQHIRVIRDQRATCRIEIDHKTAARITLRDQPRRDAREAVERCREDWRSVIMLTGDSLEVARSLAAELGFNQGEVVAEATPESKVNYVRMSRGIERGTVVMVGDGINDAAALAEADVGIAMASGTNIAIESADVVIPGDRVLAVPETIHIARQTLRTIRQNLFFAFFYNAAAIPAAAFGVLGDHGPLIAALAMGLSDITVIGNALRLKWRLRTRERRDHPTLQNRTRDLGGR